jgi:hypothetical protein
VTPLQFYNHERTHRGYRLNGRTPATVFNGAVAAWTRGGTCQPFAKLDSLDVRPVAIPEELTNRGLRHFGRREAAAIRARAVLRTVNKEDQNMFGSANFDNRSLELNDSRAWW